MKKILCYGDSNTFGFNPLNGSRYEQNERWSGILKQNLSANFEVIEEGMNNRTGFVNNPDGIIFSSQKHFPSIINKYDKIDILILAIGTNDMQFLYDFEIESAEEGLKTLINIAKTKTKQIILIPPVKLDNRILNGYFRIQFDEKSIEKSLRIGEIYNKTAEDTGCKIFDINEFAKPSDIDGLHYTPETHKLIAQNLEKFISTMA